MFKKILLIIFLQFINVIYVNAEELPDITSDIQIKYKWYKEEIDETYYPKGEPLDGYIEIKNSVKYDEPTSHQEKYCSYDPNYYLINRSTLKSYKQVLTTKYIKFENIDVPSQNIIIYYKNKIIKYKIITENDKNIIVELDNFYDTSKIMFYIIGDNSFEIIMANNLKMTAKTGYSHIENEGIIFPNKTWIHNDISYTGVTSIYEYETNSFLISNGTITYCSARKILTYRYKINKKYYDDEYHDNIEGYQKDYNDYIVYYNGNYLTNTVEITKVLKEEVKIPEYVYIEKIVEKEQNESKNLSVPIEIVKTEYKYKDKIVKEIPKKIYLVIGFLSLIIIFLIVSLIKKYVD